MNKLSELKKRGCPTCEGVDARSCFRCQGKTRMCDWYNTETGWVHYTELDNVERQVADAMLKARGRAMKWRKANEL